MKKLRIIGMVALMMGSLGLAAQTTIGGKIGANIGHAQVSEISQAIVPEIDAIAGFTGGVYINHKFDDRLSVTSGVHYKRKGFSVRQDFDVALLGVDIPLGGRVETRAQYIEVPLLLNIGFNAGKAVQPYIEVGPAFSYALQAELQPVAQLILEFNTPKVNLDLSKEIYKRMEVAAQGVAGIKIPYGKGEFDLGVSYTHAITELLEDPVLNVKMKNTGVGFHAGFGIRI